MADYDWIIFWLILVIGKLQDKVKSLASKLSSLSSKFKKFEEWVKSEIARIHATLVTIIGAAIIAAKDTAKKVVSEKLSGLKRWVEEKIDDLRKRLGRIGYHITLLFMKVVHLGFQVTELRTHVASLDEKYERLDSRLKEVEKIVEKIGKEDVSILERFLVKLLLGASGIVVGIDYRSILRNLEPTIRDIIRSELAKIETL